MIFVPAGYQRAEELACSIRELHNAAASENTSGMERTGQAT
jgi:hypothetical protein